MTSLEERLCGSFSLWDFPPGWWWGAIFRNLLFPSSPSSYGLYRQVAPVNNKMAIRLIARMGPKSEGHPCVPHPWGSVWAPHSLYSCTSCIQTKVRLDSEPPKAPGASVWDTNQICLSCYYSESNILGWIPMLPRDPFWFAGFLWKPSIFVHFWVWSLLWI